MELRRWSVALSTVLWLAAPARARGVDAKVLGWTADGTRFAYLPPARDVGEDNDMGGSSGAAEVAVVIDGRTGLVAQTYLLGVAGEAKANERAELNKLPNKDAWKAFLKADKPACAGSGRGGPDGLSVDAQAKGKHMSGRWGKRSFAFSFDAGDDEDAQMQEKKGGVVLHVVRGGVKLVSASWSGSSVMGEAGGGLSGEVRACFAAGGKRVAWIVRRAPSMMRDTGDVSVLIGAATTPRVQLVADKAMLATVAPKVGAALEAGGYFSTDAHASNEATPRAATVIYAAKGFEADAQKMAAALPGGATVGVLDWKVPFDVVVGIGATAAK